jgi:hypothetical protein
MEIKLRLMRMMRIKVLFAMIMKKVETLKIMKMRVK